MNSVVHKILTPIITFPLHNGVMFNGLLHQQVKVLVQRGTGFGVSLDVDDCLFGFLFREMPAPKAFGEAFLEQTTPTAVQALNLLQELFCVEGGEEKRF